MPAVLADLDQEHDRLQVRPSVDGRRVSHMVLETSDGRLPIVFVADDGRMPDTRVIVRTLETRK